MANTKSLQQFNNLVGIKFQLYNSLFTSLPFHTIEKTGILVSMLLLACEEGYKQQFSPKEIINIFLKNKPTIQKMKKNWTCFFVLYSILKDKLYYLTH